MNKLLVLLAIVSACGAESTALPPDAAQLTADAAMPADAARPRDAAIDTPAPEPESRGCMGNLPNSRTVTVNTGDPVPPALLNELQDMITGANRGQYIKRIMPSGWIVTTGPGVASLVANPSTSPATILGEPVWSFSASGAYRSTISFESGEIISSAFIDAFGNGTVDWSFDVIFSNSISTQSGSVTVDIQGAFNNEPASWTRHSLSFAAGPSAFVDGGKMMLLAQPNASGLCLGYLTLIMSKP